MTAAQEPDPAVAVIARRMAQALSEMHHRPADPGVASARTVGDALRKVIDALTGTSAPPDVLGRITERLHEMEEVLAEFQSVRRYEGSSEASGLSQDRAHFDWSPLLGLANPLAPPIKVAIEDGVVVGRAVFGIAYEGPPGCVHGGFVAAAFDEVLGLTQTLSGQMGMTGTLTVKYRRPTPLNTGLRFEGRLDGVSGRKVMTSAKVLADGEMTAEATGLFVTITPEKFTALSANRERRRGSGPA